MVSESYRKDLLVLFVRKSPPDKINARGTSELCVLATGEVAKNPRILTDIVESGVAYSADGSYLLHEQVHPAANSYLQGEHYSGSTRSVIYLEIDKEQALRVSKIIEERMRRFQEFVPDQE